MNQKLDMIPVGSVSYYKPLKEIISSGDKIWSFIYAVSIEFLSDIPLYF